MNFLRAAFTIGAGLLVSLAVAACGNNDDNSTSTEAAAPTTTAAAPTSNSTAEITLADTDLGQVLVGGDGRTLYLFESDTAGDASTCSGDCAAAWPPLTTKGKPRAESGVDAAKLSTFTREDGATQVAYNGHPLYYYSGDAAPGDTNGNDSDAFGAEWYAVTAAGESAGDEGESSSEDDSSSDSSTDGASSGYSY
jgi:predicted lipoprotein with Yx(FWY)xxD motif